MNTPVKHSVRKYLCYLNLFVLLLSGNLFTENLYAANTKEHTKVHWADKGKIVVSIKPLYSLVTHLTKDIEQPVLLMAQSQSPHHYNLRPSERRLLSEAKLIIWLGPQLETTLDKIIQQKESTAIAILDSPGLPLLTARAKHSTHSHRHNDNTHSIDPHVWLSAQNARIISEHIYQQLVSLDPENTSRYRANLTQLLAKIEKTHHRINHTLQQSQTPFLVYHDAFQYFEKEYALNYEAAISSDDESNISLKHLRHIHALIKEKQIHCLVYQPPKPDIAETLAEQANLNTAMLDILGTKLSDNTNAWFEIMMSTATAFRQCLAE